MNPFDGVGGFLLACGVPLITGFLAHRKGYNFFIWMLAAGCLGLIILAFLQDVRNDGATEDDEVLAAVRKRGNIIGAVLAGISILVLLIRGGAGF